MSLASDRADAPPVNSAGHASKMAQQSSVAWSTATNQPGGQLQASIDATQTFVPLEEPPVSTHSSWQLSDGAKSAPWDVEQNVRRLQEHDMQNIQNLGISFNEPLAESDYLTDEDVRQLGLLDEGCAADE